MTGVAEGDRPDEAKDDLRTITLTEHDIEAAAPEGQPHGADAARIGFHLGEFAVEDPFQHDTPAEMHGRQQNQQRAQGPPPDPLST